MAQRDAGVVGDRLARIGANLMSVCINYEGSQNPIGAHHLPGDEPEFGTTWRDAALCGSLGRDSRSWQGRCARYRRPWNSHAVEESLAYPSAAGPDARVPPDEVRLGKGPEHGNNVIACLGASRHVPRGAGAGLPCWYRRGARCHCHGHQIIPGGYAIPVAHP